MSPSVATVNVLKFRTLIACIKGLDSVDPDQTVSVEEV